MRKEAFLQVGHLVILFLPDAEGKGSYDKEPQSGWVEADWRAELKNENGELTDSTKRPSLLPALSFIQGGKSSYIQ